jgi:hypothetical protein
VGRRLGQGDQVGGGRIELGGHGNPVSKKELGWIGKCEGMWRREQQGQEIVLCMISHVLPTHTVAFCRRRVIRGSGGQVGSCATLAVS